MNLIVLDTETSDLDPEKGAAILELAWIRLEQRNGYWAITDSFERYLQYSGPISVFAQAVNHINPEKLTATAGALTRQDAVSRLLNILDNDTLIVAHNADFDSKFLPEVPIPWICTFRSAKHIWPDAPGHSNQVLRYWLRTDLDPSIQRTRYPHQAIYDVHTTYTILERMLQTHTPHDLLRMSNMPVRLKSLNFGKYKGVDINLVPRDYINWLQRQPDLNLDLKYTIESILNV